MRLPCAIGAVVLGVPTTSHTPLSGHVSPVLAVLPTAMLVKFSILSNESEVMSLLNSYKAGVLSA